VKKRRVITLVITILVLLSTYTAFADNKSDVIVSMQINVPIMEVNGVQTEIDAGRGTTPVVTEGRTLVPIRAIIEAFNGVVEWDNSTQTVIIKLENDVITLAINSNTAYLNSKAYLLDVPPRIINGRTMLPIRFIAEGFNLGVAWESDTQTVTIIRNLLDKQEYNYILSVVPEYSGVPYVYINNNIPLFKEYEIIGTSFEYYSKLDNLGRCDVCMASVADDLMPSGERESISTITPTGWINVSYDNISGKYLYNRCHLIGYQLTGENANERNLITGTRYLNIEGMLPFENEVDDYIDKTGNHVMYRVTPVFKDNNLVAHGVLMEAYSVEDNGEGISFCVYCYNVQPSITIDYLTGKSSQGEITEPENNITFYVYRTPSGKKYHSDAECGGKNSYTVNLTDAVKAGLTPCSKCAD